MKSCGGKLIIRVVVIEGDHTQAKMQNYQSSEEEHYHQSLPFG